MVDESEITQPIERLGTRRPTDRSEVPERKSAKQLMPTYHKACPYCGGSVKHEADWPDSRIYRCVSCGATVHTVS